MAGRSSSFRYLAGVVGIQFAAISFAAAGVVRFEIQERSDIAGTGYETISGRLHFEVDPGHPRNRIIADIGLAPTNAMGRVAFSSDVRIRRPKDSACPATWVEIPNRGGKAGLSRLTTQHRFAVMEIGWEFDVPAEGDRFRIRVPVARQRDDTPVRGIVRASFTPEKRATEFTLNDLKDYPPVDAGGPDSALALRACSAFPGGSPISREKWRINGQCVTLDGGFEPGKTYEIAYLAENPPIAGLGLAAIRDAVAWLRRGADAPAQAAHVYAFGSSQCGRLLREFIYLGFNTDEGGSMVFDGVMAHVAGAGRLDINRRWSTPRSVAAYATASFPFADSAQRDPVSGVTDGVQGNPRVTQRPKTFYTNTASEYWSAGRVAALTHTTPDGKRDIPLPDNVRSYLFSGTQHGPAALPPKMDGETFGNPVTVAPVLAALRLAMHRWVTEGKSPPESVYPKLAAETLVPARAVRFPALQGIPSPGVTRAGARLPNPLWPDGAGAGVELPLLVPQVDADGNDVAGIRMPDITACLGTYTGWAFRPSTEEPLPLKGNFIPFPPTRDEGRRRMDPRLSLDERYPTKEAYMERVGDSLKVLCEEGFLMGEDVSAVRTQAERRWDWLRGIEAP